MDRAADLPGLGTLLVEFRLEEIQLDHWDATRILPELVALGTGLTKLAQGKELQIIDHYETGNVEFPIRFIGADLPTKAAKLFGMGSLGLGAVMVAADEANLYHQYRTGTLKHPVNESAWTVAKEEMLTVGVAGLAVTIVGLAAPVELAVAATVAAGVISTLAVSAVEQGLQTGDWSIGSVAHGALDPFDAGGLIGG